MRVRETDAGMVHRCSTIYGACGGRVRRAEDADRTAVQEKV